VPAAPRKFCDGDYGDFFLGHDSMKVLSPVIKYDPLSVKPFIPILLAPGGTHAKLPATPFFDLAFPPLLVKNL